MPRRQEDQCAGFSVSPGQGCAGRVFCRRGHSQQRLAEHSLSHFSHLPREDKPPLWVFSLHSFPSRVWRQYPRHLQRAGVRDPRPPSASGGSPSQCSIFVGHVGHHRADLLPLSLGPGHFQVQGRFHPAQRYPLCAC